MPSMTEAVAAHQDGAVHLSASAVLAIVTVAVVMLLWRSGPKGRRFLARTGRKLIRKAWRYARITWWASRLGIGVRLAGRLQPDRWDAMVVSRQLTGLRRGKVSRTPSGVSVRMTLSGSLTLREVSGKARQLETGLALAHDTARIVRTNRADRVLLQILLRDPLAGGVLWTPPRGTVRLRDPMPLAKTAFGDVLTLDLKNRTGVFGTSGSGKSCVQRLIGAHVAQAVDADLEIWDLKFGTESQHYAGKAYRVTSASQALDRVDWFLGNELPRRAALMEAWGRSNWPESAAHPARVLIVDEGNGIIRGFNAKQQARFFQLAEQGRALGVYLVWATQFPKAENLPTELRSQLNVRVCLRLQTGEESQLVFKDEAKDGWQPHKLPGVGWLLVKSEDHREPVEAKAFWLSEDGFRALPLAGAPVEEPEPEGVDLVKDDDPVAVERVPPTPASPTVAQDVWDQLALADVPLSMSELARRTGRSKAGVHAAVHAMLADGRAVREPKGFRLSTTEEPVRESTDTEENGS
jgi:hypothetical protein